MAGFAPLYDSETGRASAWKASGNAAHVVTGNITNKFREAFETYTPGTNWDETRGTGDLVYVDGNAAAASYLVISKSPLVAGTETTITCQQSAEMPVELAVGMSMSQRTLGQEFSIEIIDTGSPLVDIPDLAISSVQQATTTLTINTTLPHGLSIGKSIGIYGCADSRMNYPALVVATVPTPNQITVTAGPGGAIPSVTAGPFTSGFVFFRERLGRAEDGTSLIFEQPTATQASLYTRSEAGDAYPTGTIAGNHSLTVGTSASVQVVAAAYTYAFAPTTEYKLTQQADRLQWSDVAIDSIAGTTNRLLRTSVVPSPAKKYQLRFRATNNDSLTIPVGQIVSVSKAGTTTATFVMDRAHNLTTTDVIVLYGVRNQTDFPNQTAAIAVASIVSPTSFTAVITATTATITSYGGYVARVQGGNLMSVLGAVSQVAQNATLSTLSDGTRQLVLTGNAAWAAPAIIQGDVLELVGCRNNTNGATLGIDGPWKVATSATTALTLVLPYTGSMTLPADFSVTDCGGALIKRTELRISYVRLFDYERERVEILTRPTTDVQGSVPVQVTGGNIAVSSGTITTVTGGGAAEDAAAGTNPLTVGGVVRTAMAPTTLVAGDAARLTMTAGAAAVMAPYAIPEVSWQTPAPVAGIVNTATPLQVKEAAGALLCNYVTSIDIMSEALTNATDLRVREPDLTCSSQTIATNILTVSTTHNLRIGDAVVFTASTVTGITAGVTYYVLTTPAATTITLSATRGGATLTISGTGVTATFHKVLWMTRIATTGLIAGRSVQLPIPLRGSVNTALQLQTATASGAGAVYASLQGFAAQ